MKLINIDSDKLNNYLLKQTQVPFIQSANWAGFQEKEGKNILKLGLENDDEIKFACLVIKKFLPFGKAYFYAPSIDLSVLTKDEIEFFIKEIKRIAKEHQVIFLRFDLKSEVNELAGKLKETIPVQPVKTIILDISKPEEELLKAMHSKTRYNIRLAKKKGVTIIKDGKDRFEEFWKIMQETNERDGFRLHTKNHYKLMLESGNGKEFKIRLYLAEYKGKIISGNIISFFGDMATYVHGASSNNFRNVMAPYLLQWEAICDAKEFGCKYYDFYGIDEKKWPGVTRFKRGFSGKEMIYSGTSDLVFNNLWYNVYIFVRKIRRAI